MRLRVLAPVALALLLSLGGCIDDEETLTLAADGSGSLKLDFTLDLSFVEKLKKLEPDVSGEDATDLTKSINEKMIRESCDAPGIKIVKLEVEDTGARKHAKVELEFKDLESLRGVSGFSDRKLEFAESGDNVDVTYQFDAKGIYGYSGMAPDDDQPPANEIDKKMKAIVDEATKTAGARFTLVLPGKVLATNGKAIAGNEKASLHEIPKNDPAFHKKLAKEPFTMTASIAKKDAPFFEKEKARQKAAQEKKTAQEKKAATPRTDPRKGGLGEDEDGAPAAPPSKKAPGKPGGE